MSPEQIQQYEYAFMFLVGAMATLTAYRWPQIAKSPRQLKIFRWTGPLLMACATFLLIFAALGFR